jgi:protein gp37
MADNSSIEWTESTWNPATGCTKISLGCQNCYAERLAVRLKAMGVKSYEKGFELSIHERMLGLPLTWKKPRMVFVNSMSDLFHQEVPEEFIRRVYQVIEQAPQHCFQMLTKRSKRLASLSPNLTWPDNLWMGVSVETARYQYRIDQLRETGAKVKFLSLEPLLGPIPNMNLDQIDWVIVGGESGPGARPIDATWVRDIRDQCLNAEVPFFFKQWGGFNKKKNGRVLDGKTWSQMPCEVAV